MKKKMIALAAVIMLLTSATFATENPEPARKAQQNFNLMFAKSTDAQWETVADFHKVTFEQAGQYLTAYYNNTGDFESVSRNITPDMLPLLLQAALREKLEASWISESFELSDNTGTRYYVTVESADEKAIYYATGTDWLLYKRSKK